MLIKPNGSRDIKPGNHSLEVVLLDTLLARQGGIICWHDYENPPVPDVTIAMNDLNIKEEDHIYLIEHGVLCFQFSREGR